MNGRITRLHTRFLAYGSIALFVVLFAATSLTSWEDPAVDYSMMEQDIPRSSFYRTPPSFFLLVGGFYYLDFVINILIHAAAALLLAAVLDILHHRTASYSGSDRHRHHSRST